MSDFFDSEIVQQELEEINKLQVEIYGNTLAFYRMSKDEKLEHIEKLSLLLEKQKIMYTRMSLSNDPKAIEIKNNIRDALIKIGMSPYLDMNDFFRKMESTIQILRKSA